MQLKPDFDRLAIEAEDLLGACRQRGLRLATAESCTGGLIAAILTAVAGSSDVFERGFVTYSDAAKTEMLGVPGALLAEHGAVSEAVARAMAKGALLHSQADIAVSVTGVAGPGGGTEAKPIGLVHFGAGQRGEPALHREKRFGDIGRQHVRFASVAEAFAVVRELMTSPT